MTIGLPVDRKPLSWKQKLLYGLGLTAALAAFAPVAALALSTVTSLAMAALVALGLFLGIAALPVLFRWWRIQVLRMLKATAKRNPVETLQLELINRQEAYEAAGRKAVAITAKRDSLAQKLAAYEQKHGKRDAELAKMIDQLSQVVDRLRRSMRETGARLGDFERFVEQQADRWELAKETGELASLLRDTEGADLTDRFLANTAIDTIRDQLNLSFAEIDQILEKQEIRRIVESGPVEPGLALGAPPQGPAPVAGNR